MLRPLVFAIALVVLCSMLLPGGAHAGESKWFVICASYPENRNDLAMQQLQHAQQYAPDAMVIGTTGYQNLRDGYLSVVIGPFEKPYAMQRLQQIKPIYQDAYVKAGW